MVEGIVPEAEDLAGAEDLVQMYTQPIFFHPPEGITMVMATIMTVRVASRVASLSLAFP